MQSVGAAYEIRSDPSIDQAFWRRYRQMLPLLITIGAALAGYFGSWGWSVVHTSLLDSLLLVCTSPLLMVGIIILRWLYRHCRPPHKNQQLQPVKLQPRVAQEITSLMDNRANPSNDPTGFEAVVCPEIALPPTVDRGCAPIVGFAGIVALLSTAIDKGSKSRHVALGIPLAGDGCLFFFICSPSPAVYLGTASLVFESHTTVWGLGPASLFGFLGDWKRFGLAFGAAFFAGFFGHACANIAVVYVSPLLISIAALWEALLGSLVGYLVGVQGPPDIMALVAAIFLLGGAALVTLGGRDKNPPDHAV
ncbi:hypothetical protein H310_06301 [Aphanomyces invadans]|uniref:Uncharacterized protein n=1 Tax=Aphanomyces invadans TaxID=157072 RepID=A0A024U627_9STRA|nr:hypothetical protein H310_06301 [Aphanomyces invadans]ETW01680.1 hypothetical protein H310_06301 [Aphanomyces invadans]|eukprot:XP_008869528.1 hypothetical protein H310_06301 [Aphanomyces invadans]